MLSMDFRRTASEMSVVVEIRRSASDFSDPSKLLYSRKNRRKNSRLSTEYPLPYSAVSRAERSSNNCSAYSALRLPLSAPPPRSPGRKPVSNHLSGVYRSGHTGAGRFENLSDSLIQRCLFRSRHVCRLFPHGPISSLNSLMPTPKAFKCELVF